MSNFVRAVREPSTTRSGLDRPRRLTETARPVVYSRDRRAVFFLLRDGMEHKTQTTGTRRLHMDALEVTQPRLEFDCIACGQHIVRKVPPGPGALDKCGRCYMYPRDWFRPIQPHAEPSASLFRRLTLGLF